MSADGTSRPPRLRAELLGPDGAELQVGADLSVDLRAAELGWTADVQYRHDARRAVTGRLRVSAELSSKDPWFLIPGAFYGENRPTGNDRIFPRFETGAHPPSEVDPLTSDHWSFRADRAATPAVFVWAGPGRGGLALAAGGQTELGITGLGLAHDSTSTTALIHLDFPYRESPVSYYGDHRPRPADVATHTFLPGSITRLRVRVFSLGADRHDYADVLRCLHTESAPHHDLQPWVDVADAADLSAEGLLHWHYDPDPGVLLETVGFDRGIAGRDGLSVDRQAMHVGWVSGVPWAYALLAHGLRTQQAEEIQAARRVIDFITTARSPSGTYWGVWYRQHGWSGSWSKFEHGLHARTLGEAALFTVRADRLSPDEQWVSSVRDNIEVILRRQRADGNLGSIHHAYSGEVLSWEGAAGLTWVAVFAEASSWDRRYLPAAEAAGRYYQTFVEREFIHGAPEDVDLAPSSEDGYAAVIAYAALYRHARNRHWLEVARRAADWMLTFRYSYNVTFGPATLLGHYDFRTRGGDQASPSNQHLHAYGLICTAELHELSGWTGDPYYAERADEALSCFRQFVARQDGDFNAYRGMVSERYYQTECFQPKGMLLTLSHAWSVGVLLLACEQMLTLGR